MYAPRRLASFACRLGAGLTFVLTTSLSTSSLAAPAKGAEGDPKPPMLKQDVPCKGCLFFPPPAETKNAPLLVVLHGDAPGGKKPLVQRDSEPFVAAAVERGIAVLAPMCPKEEGCLVGSYWQWTQGDPPAWIAKQIDAVRKDVSIDADRIGIAGWSGGASFLGYHYARLHDHYAAVIFAGGGMPPVSNACAPCSPPAYFLVGDKNPLHHLAKDLKTSVLSCTKDVTWDLLPGKDHAGEWRALKEPAKIGELLDWLANHPRHCPSTTVKPTAIAPPAPATAPESSSSAGKTLPPAPEPSAFSHGNNPQPQKTGGCTIAAPSASHDALWFGGMVMGGLYAGRRLRKGRNRPLS